MTTTEELKRMFYTAFNGQKNFITPNVILYIECGVKDISPMIAELSQGEGITGNIMYGVTFLNKNDLTLRYTDTVDKSFDDKEEAYRYAISVCNDPNIPKDDDTLFEYNAENVEYNTIGQYEDPHID